MWRSAGREKRLNREVKWRPRFCGAQGGGNFNKLINWKPLCACARESRETQKGGVCACAREPKNACADEAQTR